MLREEAAYFSTRYEDAVREPDPLWQAWAAEAAAGKQKVLFVAEEGRAVGSASSGASGGSSPPRYSSCRCGSIAARAAGGSHGR